MTSRTWRVEAAEPQGFRRPGLPAFARSLAAPVSGPSGRQYHQFLPSLLRPSLFGSD